MALALADHADLNGEAWPGRRRLSEFTGLSEATVKRAISKLRALGVLEVVSGGKGRGLLTRYRLRASAAKNGLSATPFPTQKGAADDPLSIPENGSSEPLKGVTGCTQNPYRIHKTRARAADVQIAASDDAKARELAASLRRKGERALRLSDWGKPEVVALAIDRYGADAELLARVGYDVPSNRKDGARGGDGRSYEESDASGEDAKFTLTEAPMAPGGADRGQDPRNRRASANPERSLDR